MLIYAFKFFLEINIHMERNGKHEEVGHQQIEGQTRAKGEYLEYVTILEEAKAHSWTSKYLIKIKLLTYFIKIFNARS